MPGLKGDRGLNGYPGIFISLFIIHWSNISYHFLGAPGSKGAAGVPGKSFSWN